MSPRERRLETRCEVLGLSGFTGVCDPLVVRDLSSSGMRIETTAKPRPGQAFRGRLEGPHGSFEIDSTCSWAHLAGVARLAGSDPATVYQAGLRLCGDDGVSPARVARLLHNYALVPPPSPVHCILPFEDGRSGEPTEPIAGEVRRLGLRGFALVLPPLPTLPARMDLVLLLEGRECRCRCRVLERMESRIPAGASSTELLVALEDGDRTGGSPILPRVQSVLSTVLGTLGAESPDGTEGTIPMLA